MEPFHLSGVGQIGTVNMLLFFDLPCPRDKRKGWLGFTIRGGKRLVPVAALFRRQRFTGGMDFATRIRFGKTALPLPVPFASGKHSYPQRNCVSMKVCERVS